MYLHGFFYYHNYVKVLNVSCDILTPTNLFVGIESDHQRLPCLTGLASNQMFGHLGSFFLKLSLTVTYPIPA